MEDLTKHQLILLALLVSFVTSIAASIATASLLDQAPPRVTQTIHKVVERTVEKVVPSDKGDDKPVVTQEKTVIVREEDAITDAISLVSSSLIRIYLTQDSAQTDGDENTGDNLLSRFRGFGAVIDEKGTVVSMSSLILSDSNDSYELILPKGESVIGSAGDRNFVTGLTILKIPATGIPLPLPIVIGDDSRLRLGQTTLGLGGKSSTSVSVGIISAIDFSEDGLVTNMQTSNESDTNGMPLVNLFGEVIGFAKSAGTTNFVPVSLISSSLSEFL